MTIEQTFEHAQAALSAAVNRIHLHHWDQEVPPHMTSHQQSATLRQYVNNAAYNNAWIPDILAGKTPEEIGDTHDGDLLGDDPKTGFRKYATAAIEAVKDLYKRESPDTVTVSYGSVETNEFLVHAAVARALSAYDIAKFIGIEAKLSDELTTELWVELEPRAEQMRATGLLLPLVDVGADAPLHNRLLGLSGRNPD